MRYGTKDEVYYGELTPDDSFEYVSDGLIDIIRVFVGNINDEQVKAYALEDAGYIEYIDEDAARRNGWWK